MKDWIWGKKNAEGKTPKPDGLPARTYWYTRLISKYINYERFPWEMGYPHYEELDYIFPFIIREWKKRINQEMDKKKEWEETRQEAFGKKALGTY